MTSRLFSTFSEASAFAKQVTLEQKAKASVARSTDGFIVAYTLPTMGQQKPAISPSENVSHAPASPYPEQQKKNDESEGQITKGDLKEFKDKLEKLIANKNKEREEKLLDERRAVKDRERKRAEKIKQRDERIKTERAEREMHAGLDECQPKSNKKAGKSTEDVLHNQREFDICPKCGGGGANGNCTKCDGTGWVIGRNDSPVGSVTWKVNEFGTREEYKKMRGQLWGDMRNRGRGR